MVHSDPLKKLLHRRVITVEQERLLRLHHHDFTGMSLGDAAARMDLLIVVAEDMLDDIYRVAPQLWPILSKTEHKIYKMYSEQGYTQAEIAEHLRTTKSLVQRIIADMREDGMPGLSIRTRKPRVQRYGDYMEPDTKRKF